MWNRQEEPEQRRHPIAVRERRLHGDSDWISHQTSRSPIAKSPNHQIAKSPNHQINK
jgi:hypothetical protein